MGYLVGAPMRPGSSIWLQDTIDCVLDRLDAGTALGAHGDIVECAIHVKDAGKYGSGHEEDAEAPRVWHHVARAERVDVFGCKYDARDGKRPLAAVQDGIERASGRHAARGRETLGHRYLAGPSGFGQPAVAQVKSVDSRLAAIGDGDGNGGCRLRHARHVQQNRLDDTQFDAAYPRDRCDALAKMQRRARQPGKDGGKPVAVVECVAGLLQRAIAADGDDDRRDAACHDKRNGEDLRPHSQQIAQKFAIENRHDATNSLRRAVPAGR